jgi:hypothetical protein
MKLDNPFPDSVRNLYLYVFACLECLRSDLGLELHHIKGRISPSPFNAAAICPDCHVHIEHNLETHRRLFKKNAKFLYEQGYSPTIEDLQFIQDNPELVDDEFLGWLFSLSTRK